MLDCLCFLCGINSDKFIINVEMLDKLEHFLGEKVGFVFCVHEKNK